MLYDSFELDKISYDWVCTVLHSLYHELIVQVTLFFLHCTVLL